MKLPRIFSLAAAMAVTASASAITPLWLRDVKISPDGEKIAFTYKGDIYTVAAAGGKATRLTATDDVYESVPVWSPDGKHIAFASDRHGSHDVFVMSAEDGSGLTRLTTFSGAETPEAFTVDGKRVLFSAAIQDPVSSVSFPSARFTELYSVAVADPTDLRQELATPAQMLSLSPDGKLLSLSGQERL